MGSQVDGQDSIERSFVIRIASMAGRLLAENREADQIFFVDMLSEKLSIYLNRTVDT